MEIVATRTTQKAIEKQNRQQHKLRSKHEGVE